MEDKDLNLAIFGFSTDGYYRSYKCENCGNEKYVQQPAGSNAHKWEVKVCPNCGFKSLKPVQFGDVLSAVLREVLN